MMAQSRVVFVCIWPSSQHPYVGGRDTAPLVLKFTDPSDR